MGKELTMQNGDVQDADDEIPEGFIALGDADDEDIERIKELMRECQE